MDCWCIDLSITPSLQVVPINSSFNHLHRMSQLRRRTGRQLSRLERPSMEWPRGACSIRLLHVAVMGLAVCQASGFTYSSEGSHRPTYLFATKQRSEAVVQKVKPRRSTSEAKRERAFSAMKKNLVHSAVHGADGSMLELLSDQYLYPVKGGSVQRKRPKGRPECVPGAMAYETLLRYQELEQQRLQAVENGSNDAPVSDAEIAAIAPYVSSVKDGSEDRVTKVKNFMSNGAKGASSADSVSNGLHGTSATKPRKRVAKHLPTPRTEKEESEEMKRPKHPNGMDLHKYYRTELLTQTEEYSLGMKVQFMTKCEQVHEGLAAQLMRLPSIEEWAQACGFVEADPMFVPALADEQLRPAGSETMFVETAPNMFVGNGLAQSAGPGRGRGRVKKPPPLKLKDFYDDSEVRANTKSEKDIERARKKLQPLNRGTVTDFVELMMTGKESKQRMVQSNMRLVVSIARKYSNVGVGLQDLVQEGSLGLSRAAEKFDPKKGFKFSTYASWWIQQAVFRSIAYHSRTIRLPVHVHNLLNRLRKVRSALLRELGRAPTNEEIADKLGMTVQKYNKMLHLTKRSISLESPRYKQNPKDIGHESQDSLGDTIASKSQDDAPEKRVDHSLFHEDLTEMLNILEKDERLVITMRYGLSDGLTRTVTAVAAHMKQSKAWVRSQECRALRKLRRPWYEKKLKEHQDALSN